MKINMSKCKKADFLNVNRLILLFFYLIDKLKQYKPNTKTLQKLNKNRASFNAKMNKEKIDEMNEKAREDKFRNMSAKEKEKHMERLKRRQKNKMMKKMKVMTKM